METLQIETGKVEIQVKRDGKEQGVISFDPSDILFAEKFYRLISEFEMKMVEYQGRSEKIDSESGVDENGIPVNFSERVELLKDVSAFMREKIDILFGEGTSQIAFGDYVGLDMLSQFFNGVTPFIRKTRQAKIEKYTHKRKRK